MKCVFSYHTFNKDNVESVMKALQDEEGSDIPADVEGESYGNDSHETWGYRPRKRQPKVELNQMTLAGFAQSLGISADPLFEAPESEAGDTTEGGAAQEESVSSQQQKPDTNIDNPSVRNVPAPQSINQDTTFAPQQSDVAASSTPELEQEQLFSQTVLTERRLQHSLTKPLSLPMKSNRSRQRIICRH